MFEFLQAIADFFTTGIYEFFTELLALVMVKGMVLWFKAQLAGLEFAWGVGSTIIQNLNISQHISTAFSGLSGQVVATLSFFRFPEAINMLLTAGATRFVLKFIPFI